MKFFSKLQLQLNCVRGEHKPALFCDRDLEINPVTLKLEGDLNIPKMYPHTKIRLLA